MSKPENIDKELDEILDRELGGFSEGSETQAVLNTIKAQLRPDLKALLHSSNKRLEEQIAQKDKEIKELKERNG